MSRAMSKSLGNGSPSSGGWTVRRLVSSLSPTTTGSSARAVAALDPPERFNGSLKELSTGLYSPQGSIVDWKEHWKAASGLQRPFSTSIDSHNGSAAHPGRGIDLERGPEELTPAVPLAEAIAPAQPGLPASADELN